MATDTSTPLNTDAGQRVGVGDVLRYGVTAVKEDPLIVLVFLGFAAVALLLQAGQYIFSFVASAVTVPMAYRALGGEPIATNSTAVRVILAFLAAIVAGIAILVGLVLLVIPGIYLAVRLRLVIPAVMLEDAGPLESLGRSFELTDGHGWTVLGVMFVFWIASLVLTGGALAVTGIELTFENAEEISALAQVVGPLEMALFGPIAVGADAAMYGLFRTSDETDGGGAEGDAGGER